MLDSLAAPERAAESLDLQRILGPHAAAECVAVCHWRTRTGRREASVVYVVLHTGCGRWTSVSRIVRERGGRLAVHVAAVREGDSRSALRAWALAQLGDGGVPQAAP